jgi:nitronate monooxygenase
MMDLSARLPAVDAFLALSGARLPIIQAPIGSAGTPKLAAAVAKAGGVGGLALTWATTESAHRAVSSTKEQAQGAPFLANFVLHFSAVALDAALAAGAPIITFSWGVDSALITRARAAGAVVGVQVGNPSGALLALQAGAQFLIVQGHEAGGHVQSTMPLRALLAKVLAISGDTPVVAAGSIATGRQIADLLLGGAAAVTLGTRFVATTESAAHPLYKDALCTADAVDTALTNCFEVDWPFAMHRVLRNETFERWEAAGSPSAPNRPGNGDTVFTDNSKAFPRYCDTPPSHTATGDVLNACLYAGTGVTDINSVMPAADILHDLWTSAQVEMEA